MEEEKKNKRQNKKFHLTTPTTTTNLYFWFQFFFDIFILSFIIFPSFGLFILFSGMLRRSYLDTLLYATTSFSIQCLWGLFNPLSS